MRVVIQRVLQASLAIDGKKYSSIENGMLILAGFEEADTNEDLEWITQKVINLRIFNDAQGVMNESVTQTNGSVLIVSQFTLHASTKKGNRPSYIKAARPDVAIPLYEMFVEKIRENVHKVETGVFGADMKVELINDGPVTIIMDSKNKE